MHQTLPRFLLRSPSRPAYDASRRPGRHRSCALTNIDLVRAWKFGSTMGGPRDASTRRTQYCHCDRRATDWPWYLPTSPSWSWSCLGQCIASSVPGGAAVLHHRHRPPRSNRISPTAEDGGGRENPPVGVGGLGTTSKLVPRHECRQPSARWPWARQGLKVYQPFSWPVATRMPELQGLWDGQSRSLRGKLRMFWTDSRSQHPDDKRARCCDFYGPRPHTSPAAKNLIYPTGLDQTTAVSCFYPVVRSTNADKQAAQQ